MTENDTNIFRNIAVLTILVLTAFLLGRCTNILMRNKVQPEGEKTVKIDTIHIHTRDTLKVEVEKVRIHTKILEVKDTLFVHDTILLRESKVYADTISQIWFSGIEAQIDSIEYTLPRDTTIIKETIEIRKKKGFGQSVTIGIQAGYGVGFGIKDKTYGAEPYIGIGVTYGFGYHW